MRKSKTEVWWCIESIGLLLPWTASSQKKDAIRGYDDNVGTGDPNRLYAAKLKKRSIRAVKIEIRRIVP